nr:ATP-dependent DNA helicase pif1-like [Ipomoea batatas]
MPTSFRRLFSTMLVFCDVPSPHGLWMKYKEHLCEDLISSSINIIDAENKCLHMISDVLESLGKNINDFALVSYHIGRTKQQRIQKEIKAEKNLLPNEADLLAITKLNQSQRAAFDTIIAWVYSSSGGVFFVDGPGGTGKTFLYRCLLAKVRSNHDIALATATTGVAASLLPGGRTAHSRFKIPINGDDKFICNIGKQSAEAALLRECKLIIWDEATMANRRNIENVETTLRDITNCDKIFGGKVVVFGGDFRQTLPVIRSGSKRDFIEASLIKSQKICCDPYPLMRGILTPKNEYVDEINNTLIARFPGEEKYYVSYDELLDSTSHNEFADFLHSISVPGLPPHKLIQKKNCPVILLRNINPAEGLCNGTRLICDDFRDHVIRYVIAFGEQFEEYEQKEPVDEYEKGERLDLEDNDPEYETEEYGGPDYDDRGIEYEEVQEEGEEIEEHEEEYIGDEGEGDMVEEEVEDVNEDLESEEDDDHVGEEHGQMVDEVEEDEHDEVVKERRKRKELEIFIGGLDKDATEDDLRKVLSEVGDVTEVRFMMNPQTMKNKGFAFLRFTTVEQASL